MARIVLTGPGGSGKSSVIDRLSKEKGYPIVEEVARALITEYQENAPELLPWNNRYHFQTAVESRQLENYFKYPDAIYDRSLIDEIGYRNHFGILVPHEVKKACIDYRYDFVFMFEPWKEIYQNDSVRLETYENQVSIFENLVEAYREMRYSPIIVPKDSIENRTDFILQHIEQWK